MVTVYVYMKVVGAEMFLGGEGYTAQGFVDCTGAVDVELLQKIAVKSTAGALNVPPEQVFIISKSEYDEEMEEKTEDIEDPDDYWE